MAQFPDHAFFKVLMACRGVVTKFQFNENILHLPTICYGRTGKEVTNSSGGTSGIKVESALAACFRGSLSGLSFLVSPVLFYSISSWTQLKWLGPQNFPRCGKQTSRVYTSLTPEFAYLTTVWFHIPQWWLWRIQMQDKGRNRKRRVGQDLRARIHLSLFSVERPWNLNSNQASQIVTKMHLSGRKVEWFSELLNVGNGGWGPPYGL